MLSRDEAIKSHVYVIEKLPSSWTDAKNYLKLKRKWMILEDLIFRQLGSLLSQRTGDK